MPSAAASRCRRTYGASRRSWACTAAPSRAVVATPVAVREAVTPELLHTRTDGPALTDAIADVEVAGRATRRRQALTDREPVLELARGQQLAQHMVRAVELPDLAQRPVRHEVHGIFAVAHREPEGEAAAAVGRIQGDQVTAAVRLHRPAGIELAVVARRAHERGAQIGRVGHEHAPLGPHARAAGEAVPQPQLLHPPPVAPHTGPRGRAPCVTVTGGPDALDPELQ